MSDSISLFKTLDTPVSWRTSVCPCMLLTAGIINRVSLQLRNSPDSRELPPLTPGGIKITFYEIPVYRPTPIPEVSAEIREGDTEITVQIRIPETIKRGYYRAHIKRWENDVNNITDVYEAWVTVDKTTKPIVDKYMSVNSVRVQFADVCSLDNKLLESLEVSTGDIVEAVNRCLEQWGDTAPRVHSYLGSNFPYPEILRVVVLYMLLQSLWTFLERNRMQYNAGGVMVDLQKRADSFRILKEEYEQKWRIGMSQAKMQENLMSFDDSLVYM